MLCSAECERCWLRFVGVFCIIIIVLVGRILIEKCSESCGYAGYEELNNKDITLYVLGSEI